MSSSERFTTPFVENDWTEFARKHSINVHLGQIVHRSPRLGFRPGRRRTLAIGDMDLYALNNPWENHIKELQRSAGYVVKK